MAEYPTIGFQPQDGFVYRQSTGPPVRVHQTQISSMKSFNDEKKPCFHGDNRVLMSDGSQKKVSELKKGDEVMSMNSKCPVIGKINCVIKTRCENNKCQMMISPSELKITNWHPINTQGKWQFPCEIKDWDQMIIDCDYVYNFVVDLESQTRTQISHGCIMSIQSMLTCTLGHGFTDDEVITHPYWGTEKVIDDLKKTPGYETGLIIFEPSPAIRNSDGEVIGLKL
jgi:hypothetical protein